MVLALVAAISTVSLATVSSLYPSRIQTCTLTSVQPAPEPVPEALVKRNCPRTSTIGAAQEIASLFLGKGNNKSNEIERLIEELVALLEGEHPKCDYQHVYLECEDGQHWGWGSSGPPAGYYKRDAIPNDDNCNQYPYKSCQISESFL